MRNIVRENKIEVVRAIGGGSAIDTAKATAYYENLPVVIMASVAATDAPCTGLSVIYNDDGSFCKYIFYPKNPDTVIVDTSIIAKAPVKFLVCCVRPACALSRGESPIRRKERRKAGIFHR